MAGVGAQSDPGPSGTRGVDVIRKTMIWRGYDTATANPFGGSNAIVNKNSAKTDGVGNLAATGKRMEHPFGRRSQPTGPSANPDPLTTDRTPAGESDTTVDFDGFDGQSVVTIGGRDRDLALDKNGATTSTLAAPEPAVVGVLGDVGLLARRSRRTPVSV